MHRNPAGRLPMTLIPSMICGPLCCVVVAVLLDARAALAAPDRIGTEVRNAPELDAGFRLLYELRFREARGKFQAWQKSHPEDPLGSAAEAASYLFEECYRQRVLSSDYFLDDDRFLGRTPLSPDTNLRAKFDEANKRARDLAQLQLKANSENPNALFAMTLSLGMEANYACLIDRHQLRSLKMVRNADAYAKKVLTVAPGTADAYLGLGMTNYIIGSLPAYKKLYLGVTGIRGDKDKGIRQLGITAAHGQYLRPFAKILLALAALREQKVELARAQLTQLAAEFPTNPLFGHELAKIR